MSFPPGISRTWNMLPEVSQVAAGEEMSDAALIVFLKLSTCFASESGHHRHQYQQAGEV